MDRNGWAAIPDVLHAAAGALEEGRSRKRSQRESRIKAFGPQRANAIGKTNFMRRVIAGCINRNAIIIVMRESSFVNERIKLYETANE